MTYGTAVVLQARIGSTRLPGKVLADLAGRTVLAHCIERLRVCSGLPVILATTRRVEDDAVADAGERLGVAVVRGDDEDVLARFVQAIEGHGLREVIRATADNPCVDMDAPLRTLALLRRTGADHVVEHGLPYGAAVEAVTADALLRSSAATQDAYDREHVTPFVRRDPRFRAVAAIAPGDVRRPALRLTVDTYDDLKYVRALVARAGRGASLVPLRDLIAVAEAHAELPHPTTDAAQGTP